MAPSKASAPSVCVSGVHARHNNSSNNSIAVITQGSREHALLTKTLVRLDTESGGVSNGTPSQSSLSSSSSSSRFLAWLRLDYAERVLLLQALSLVAAGGLGSHLWYRGAVEELRLARWVAPVGVCVFVSMCVRECVCVFVCVGGWVQLSFACARACVEVWYGCACSSFDVLVCV